VNELPKTAHRTEAQRAQGYLNAAQLSLGIAIRRIHGPGAAGRIRKLTKIVDQIAAISEEMNP
jgi:hypothetical protein